MFNEERFSLDADDSAHANGMAGTYHSVNYNSVPEEIE
jgi:hypothetical protein